MAAINDSILAASHRNTIERRENRQRKVMRFARGTEAAQIVMGLRRVRIGLDKRMKEALAISPTPDLCDLVSTLVKVNDQILRMIGYPKPPVAREPKDGLPTKLAEAIIDAQDLTPPA